VSNYYQTRYFFNNFTTNEDIAQQLGEYRHIPLHFSPTNALLFKSLCNVFIGFGIIKELPGLVGSGTLYKAIPVRARTGNEVSRRLRPLGFKTILALIMI
jgi:hypothetical protein